MNKVLAFIAFTYHYLAYQIPMKLMLKALHDGEKSVHITNIDDSDKFVGTVERFYKWAAVVTAHQEKCDYYRDIVES